MGDLDVKSLVIYHDYKDSEVVGVKEFHVAKALLEGQQERLGALVPSQWGLVHLFDLCLWFGHIDTALAVARHSVIGCKLEDHHLGALPHARNAPSFHVCRCEGWTTCSCCCWGFPVDNGAWMKDWDAKLEDAAEAAKRAAKTPVVKGILEISSTTEVLPLTMSDAVAARLLDIAILCGNSTAAANLAKTFSVRPLRRWTGYVLLDSCSRQVLFAALLAGANFHDLHSAQVPLLLELALELDPEQWQQVEHFLSSKPWWPSSDLKLGHWFLFDDDDLGSWIDAYKVRNGLRSGWNLKHIWIELNGKLEASLLDVAVLCGQSHCADALATAGVQLREDSLVWLKQACRGESLDRKISIYGMFLESGSASECKSAASAAALAFLRKSFKSKGVAVYQVLTKKFQPRGVPIAMVHHILGFSMEVSEILDEWDLWDELDQLWDEVRDWLLPSLEVKADGNDETLHMDLAEELSDVDVVGEPGAPSAEPTQEPEADVKSTDDLMTDLQLSRDQVPVLNMDGVCVFRLTSGATTEHVARVLLDACGPLAELHSRVLEAGCEVDPEWNPVKALLVPITESQMAELQGLAEHGYELSREDHILALQSDQELITEALRANLPYRNRPKLKKVGPEVAVPGDPQQDEDIEDEPLLVLESGLRTNSSLGFPSYPSSA